jgi:hypothetical protein
MKAERNTLPDRDPRNDPQPGDVLITPDGRQRIVVTLRSKGRFVDWTDGKAKSGRLSIMSWQHWCRSDKAQAKQ